MYRIFRYFMCTHTHANMGMVCVIIALTITCRIKGFKYSYIQLYGLYQHFIDMRVFSFMSDVNGKKIELFVRIKLDHIKVGSSVQVHSLLERPIHQRK